MKYDVASAEAVLFYTGPDVVAGVPADDLSGNALARLAWIRGGQKGDPASVSQEAIAKVADELASTGSYSKKPATPVEDKK